MTKSATVTTKQIRRSVAKPTVTISLYTAKRLLKKEAVAVQESEAYSIYECGHIFNVKDDPSIITYYIGQNRGIRSCPICINKKLTTKYKLCGCGAEHVGKRVQPSECCSQCSALRRKTGRNTRKNEHLKNGHLADPDRCFCVHWEDCITEYFQYQTVPCKKCRRYKVGQGNQDPLTIRY